MGSWYLSKEEIERGSPSRRDGMSAAKESELRGTYCSFMRDVGFRLLLPQITIATAIMLCHRFYLYQSHAKNQWQTIATVCIFLASKIEDTPCPLQRVVIAAYETMYRRDPDATHRISQKELLEKQKALILVGESLLLATIRFDFNIQHPYEPLKLALKNLGISQKEVKQLAVHLINDALRTTLVVQFKPHYIAAGSLFVAAKFHNLRLPSENGKVWWNEFDVAPKQLQDVKQQMTELFMRRSQRCTGPATKPTPALAPAPAPDPAPATTPDPAPTPLEKKQIISIPEPVLRFTYSRRGPIMSASTPATTVVQKQQIISTADPVPAPTVVQKQQIISTANPVPAPAMVTKEQVISTADPVPASTTIKKRQRSWTPTPAALKKQKIISTPDPVQAPTAIRKQQSWTPTAVKRHQIISTPDYVLRHTHPSRTSLMSNNHDREACRFMPVDSLAHQNSVSSARSGDHKSVRTHTDQSLNKIAMHGRSEKQYSQAALKGDHSLDSTAMDVGWSEKSSRAVLKVDRSLNGTEIDRRWSEKQSSGARLNSIVIDRRWPEKQSSRPAPKDDRSLYSTGMDESWPDKSPRAAPKANDRLDSTGMDGRWSEKHSSREALKDNHRFTSTGMDGRWSEKHSSWDAPKDHHRLNSTGMDGRWSEQQSSWEALKDDHRLNGTGMDGRWSEQQFTWKALKDNHRLNDTGMDGRWSKKHSSWEALKDNHRFNSTGMDGLRWSEQQSSWETMKDNRRFNSTGMDGRWSEQQSSQQALRTDHAYLVRNLPKDINATGVTNLIRNKRRIEEVGEHPSPVDKYNRDAWTGRQIRSMIVVETKPPSWKRQRF